MSASSSTRTSEVLVTAADLSLPGLLTVPENPCGTVIFAHGSGSSRRSARNRMVAALLSSRGCATLLFDLLTPDEAEERRNVFDIALLARRVRDATMWVRGQAALAAKPIGYFGASTGAAASLVAAAGEGGAVAAVVSRGGRPDLAGDALARVAAPTLLIVGGLDTAVLALNRDARRLMRADTALEVVGGATHLFEEPGALEEVARLAGDWFTERFRAGAQAARPDRAAGAAGAAGGLTPQELEHYRQLLLRHLRERAGGYIDVEREAADTRARGRYRIALDTGDRSSESEREDILQELGNVERQEVLEILAALDRIDAGSYGICERTGQKIPRERLQAIPWARHVVEAARTIEEASRAAIQSRD